MEKLKIWDLEEGKEYRFYIGETNNENNEKFTYKINSEKQLISVNQYGCETLSLLKYNQIIAGYFILKKELDWSKIPKGTKVQVRSGEEFEWINAYFVEFKIQDGYFPFIAGPHLDDNFTNCKMEEDSSDWQCCRIHESVKIPDEWYKEVK